MSANSLQGGSTLAFTLSSTGSSQGQLTSRASVTIDVNAPPSFGLFYVSPNNGIELTTSFIMSASLWVDPDLTLEYAFGFIDASGTNVLLAQQKIAYSSRLLPAGQNCLGFNTSCLLSVFDSFNTFTSVNTSVTVTKLVISPAELESKVSNLLNNPSDSQDKKAEIVNLGTARTNTVDFGINTVDYCAALLRTPCSLLANTCGACMSGYLDFP
jgi:hypothetical protein